MKTDFKVINVIHNGQVTSEWITPLKTLLTKISSGVHRLANNYSYDNMQLNQHLSFDLLVNQHDEIISFGGVYNGGRYPEGVFRVLNRTWVAEEYRVKHGGFRYLTSEYILPAQIAANAEKLKLIFVSRERLSGRLFLKRWQQHGKINENWQLSENLVQVVPNVEKKSCYQFICSRQFQPHQWDPKVLTPQQWKQLPE